MSWSSISLLQLSLPTSTNLIIVLFPWIIRIFFSSRHPCSEVPEGFLLVIFHFNHVHFTFTIKDLKNDMFSKWLFKFDCNKLSEKFLSFHIWLKTPMRTVSNEESLNKKLQIICFSEDMIS